MDKSVITKAAQGDKKSFKMIFEYYLPVMRPVAMRYAKSHVESEDILQDSFIKVYCKINSYKFQGEFAGWIKSIVINTALNYYRRNKNLYSYQQLDSLADIKSVPEEEGDNDLLTGIDSDAILEAVKELPDGYRIVFNLFVFENHSHRQIAEMLNITEVTSRTQFFKARKLLKKILLQATK
jgi:RNA polymerase sigma factor (sigma-70 family)